MFDLIYGGHQDCRLIGLDRAHKPSANINISARMTENRMHTEASRHSCIEDGGEESQSQACCITKLTNWMLRSESPSFH